MARPYAPLEQFFVDELHARTLVGWTLRRNPYGVLEASKVSPCGEIGHISAHAEFPLIDLRCDISERHIEPGVLPNRRMRDAEYELITLAVDELVRLLKDEVVFSRVYDSEGHALFTTWAPISEAFYFHPGKLEFLSLARCQKLKVQEWVWSGAL